MTRTPTQGVHGRDPTVPGQTSDAGNGYWFWGRTSFYDLWHDLRAVTREIRPDRDLSTPGLREARPRRPDGWSRRCRQRRRRRRQPIAGEAVQVAPGPPGGLTFLPAGLDDLPVGQPDQDRVQGSRLQPGLAGQVIAVPPVRWPRGQHRESLSGEGGAT
jgi:hypothetical protein